MNIDMLSILARIISDVGIDLEKERYIALALWMWPYYMWM